MRTFTISVISALLLLSGCAGTKEFRSPSGDVMHVTKCKFSEAQCFNDAFETCKGPYEVLNGVRSTGGLLADALPGPVSWFKMTYKCGAGSNVIPEFRNDGRPVIMPQMVVPQFTPPQQPAPANVTCTKFGNSVNCSAY